MGVEFPLIETLFASHSSDSQKVPIDRRVLVNKIEEIEPITLQSLESCTQAHCYFVSPRLEHIPLTRSSGHLLAPSSFNSVEPAASEQSTNPWDERGIAGPAF